MRLVAIFAIGCTVSACATGYEGEPPLPLAPSNPAPVVVFAPQTTIQMPAQPAPTSAPAPAVGPSLSVDWHRVLILQTTHLDRPAEVVGVVDVHEEMGKHEQALDELRMKAARLGAHVVVGVEFHHGEGHGTEPTHLSGLAVRFVDGQY